jgi:D-alanyl-D-alanine carboxypeptidase/D-alanyl-D-alanine-endopeptidase (penicillin-binding protein 4)
MVIAACAQTMNARLATAFKQFENDPQLKHAISSLHVIDAKSGKVVFSKNAQIGLVPASTQKIITAATAFELLGKEYIYKTEFGFDQKDMSIVIKSFGDPTFGSPRYKSTDAETILSSLQQKVKDHGKSYSGVFQIDNTNFETQSTPNGWIFEDIGNYYGAGAGSFNWRENQFDLFLKSSSKIGDSVKILSVNGNDKLSIPFVSELRSAAKGTGDNAYLYLPVGSKTYFVRGTIPINQNNFKIIGAFYDAPEYFS